jgi:hypothetical protein
LQLENRIKLTTFLETWAIDTQSGNVIKPVSYDDLDKDAQEIINIVYDYSLASCSLNDIATVLGSTLDNLKTYFLNTYQIDIVKFYARTCAEGILRIEKSLFEKAESPKANPNLVMLFLSKRKPEAWSENTQESADTYIIINQTEALL